jgi:hypothetical protein
MPKIFWKNQVINLETTRVRPKKWNCVFSIILYDYTQKGIVYFVKTIVNLVVKNKNTKSAKNYTTKP